MELRPLINPHTRSHARCLLIPLTHVRERVSIWRHKVEARKQIARRKPRTVEAGAGNVEIPKINCKKHKVTVAVAPSSAGAAVWGLGRTSPVSVSRSPKMKYDRVKTHHSRARARTHARTRTCSLSNREQRSDACICVCARARVYVCARVRVCACAGVGLRKFINFLT